MTLNFKDQTHPGWHSNSKTSCKQTSITCLGTITTIVPNLLFPKEEYRVIYINRSNAANLLGQYKKSYLFIYLLYEQGSFKIVISNKLGQSASYIPTASELWVMLIDHTLLCWM